MPIRFNAVLLRRRNCENSRADTTGCAPRPQCRGRRNLSAHRARRHHPGFDLWRGDRALQLQVPLLRLLAAAELPRRNVDRGVAKGAARSEGIHRPLSHRVLRRRAVHQKRLRRPHQILRRAGAEMGRHHQRRRLRQREGGRLDGRRQAFQHQYLDQLARRRHSQLFARHRRLARRYPCRHPRADRAPRPSTAPTSRSSSRRSCTS